MSEQPLHDEADSSSETIHLNQRFTLLNPARTEHHEAQAPLYGDSSSMIRLDSGVVPTFPLDIHVSAVPGRYSKGFVLTPFNPSIGNEVVPGDLVFQTRLRRMVEQRTELKEKVDSPLASHTLIIQSGTTLDSWRAMRPLGVDIDAFNATHDPQQMAFNPEYLSQLQALRLMLTFPGGSYVARPTQSGIANGSVDFSFFYPLETGPLPTNEDARKLLPGLPYSLAEGFPLLVPFNKSDLETIKGMFFIE